MEMHLHGVFPKLFPPVTVSKRRGRNAPTNSNQTTSVYIKQPLLSSGVCSSPRFIEMAGYTSSAIGVLLLLLLCCTMWTASATDHTVGGSTGWANGVDYTKWTSGKTFVAGDSLSKI